MSDPPHKHAGINANLSGLQKKPAFAQGGSRFSGDFQQGYLFGLLDVAATHGSGRCWIWLGGAGSEGGSGEGENDEFHLW